MTISWLLKDMTVEEKLQAMEELWADLFRRMDAMPSPGWHGELLAQREAAIARGELVFEDWETARKKIQQDIILEKESE